MGIFTEIADQWQIADDAFSRLEQLAFTADDELAFDKASEQRKRNDQAYFLFLFTRFEYAINQAAVTVVSNRVSGALWPERRIWEAWSKNGMERVTLLAKVEVLVDKSRAEFATIKGFYEGRNAVAHGGIWTEQFLVSHIAQIMEDIAANFPTL